MPRYFFDTDDGRRTLRDEGGIDLPDLNAVAAEAFGLLRDLVQDMMSEGERRITADVRDERGVIVYRGEMTIRGRKF